MRVLVLDDEQYRHDGYARRWGSRHELVHVRSANEAADALRGEPFDFATLDHDLGPGGNGQDVARFIAGMAPSARPRFVAVHSFNPPGAHLMVAILRKAGVPCEHKPYSFEAE